MNVFSSLEAEAVGIWIAAHTYGQEFKVIFSWKNVKSKDRVADGKSMYFGDPTNTEPKGILSGTLKSFACLLWKAPATR